MESSVHALRDCSLARKIWKAIATEDLHFLRCLKKIGSCQTFRIKIKSGEPYLESHLGQFGRAEMNSSTMAQSVDWKRRQEISDTELRKS